MSSSEEFSSAEALSPSEEEHEEDVVSTDRPKMRPGTKVFWILVVLAVPVAVAGFWLFVPTTYTAKSFIQVEPPNPKGPMSLTEVQVAPELMDRVVQDQIVGVTSEVVLQEALKSAEVMGTQWYAEAKGNVGELLDALKDTLKVIQVPNTNCIQVSFTIIQVPFTTRSPQDAPIIVNTVIEKYIVELEAGNKTALQKDWAYYRDKTNEKHAQLRNRRNDKTQFIATQFQSPGVTMNINVVGQTYQALAEAVTKLEAEKLQFKAAFENLKGLTPDQITVSPQMQVLIKEDSQIAWLSDSQLATEIDLETKVAEVGENDPAVKTFRARLKVITAKLVELRLAKENEVLDYQLKSAETAYLNATQAEVQLRERITEEEAKQADTDRKMAEYRGIEEDVRMMEEEYNQLNQFTNQLGLLMANENISRVKQLGQAQKSKEGPDPGLRATASVIGAATPPIGFGILLLIRRWISALRSHRRLMREATMRWLRHERRTSPFIGRRSRAYMPTLACSLLRPRRTGAVRGGVAF